MCPITSSQKEQNVAEKWISSLTGRAKCGRKIELQVLTREWLAAYAREKIGEKF
jgi:hypothetical protein